MSSRVQSLINEALRKSHGSTRKQVLENAWQELVTKREEACGDMDLVKAEHYMFARFHMSRLGPPFLRVFQTLIVVYDIVKIAAMPPFNNLLKAGNCPLSTPLVAIPWAMLGADDGVADFIADGLRGSFSIPVVVTTVEVRL